MIDKAPPAYPLHALSDWDKYRSTQGVRVGGVRDQERAQLFAQLQDLGFQLLFKDAFAPLQAELHARKQNAEERKRYGRHARVRGEDREIEQQLWHHPAGVIAVVERYRHQGSIDWGFNSAVLHFQVAGGYGFSVLMQSHDEKQPHSFSTVRGAAPLVAQESAARDLQKAWKQVQRAASEGRLVPIEQWEEMPSPSQILLTHQPYTYALPAIKAGMNMADLSRIERTLVAKAAPKLGKRRLAMIDQLRIPEEEKATWRRFVGMEVVKVMDTHSIGSDPESPSPEFPKWAVKLASGGEGGPGLMPNTKAAHRAHYRHRHAAWALHELLELCGMTPGDPLHPDERDTVALWLEVASDRRHPNRLADKLQAAHATPLSRFGLEFHHLLFAVGHLPGVPSKLHAWQAQQSQETLTRLSTEPAADGKTLPIRWADVWLHLPNSRVEPRRCHLRRETARRGLENLARSVPMESWCLSTDRASMWDEAIGIDINPTVDEDLVPHHMQGVHTLVEWAAHKPFRLPDAIFAPAIQQPGFLSDPDTVHAVIAQSEGLNRACVVEDRMKLLMPVVSLMQQHVLRQAASAPSALPRRSKRL